MMKFYKCSHCGNIVAFVENKGVPVMCCGQKIQWVALETKQGNQRKLLAPGQKPEVKFAITPDDEVVAVYEYCNLHGLWKS